MRIWGLFLLALACSADAAAQTCIGSLPASIPGWTSGPAKTLGTAALTRVGEAVCTGCERRVVAELFTGPAPEPFRKAPIGQLTGLRFAETVVADPAQRFGFLESILRSARQGSPACTIDGQVDAVETATTLPTVIANVRAQCTVEPREVNALFYSGYDGQCLYQLQIVWSPFVDLGVADRERILALLKQARFGS